MENIVITGATSGFGVNWLKNLDKTKQCRFFVLGRDKTKFNHLTTHTHFNNETHFIHCELDSIASINHAVAEIKGQIDVIDVLINNAGVWSNDEITMSKDNIELTLAVNQIAPYLLIGKLLPLIKKSDNGNIINTASFRHQDAKIDLNDIELKGNFNAEQAYCNSKLYSILLTKKLATMLKNSPVTVNCFDPGIVDTPMLAQAFPKSIKFIYPLFRRLLARTPDKGAETGVFLSNKQAMTGTYFKDCKPKKTSKLALDSNLSDWLWSNSEKLTNFKYE